MTFPEVPPGYKLKASGLYQVNEKSDGTAKEYLLCGPLWISAKTKDRHELQYGLEVSFIDDSNRERRRYVQYQALHDQNSSLVTDLAGTGLYVQVGAKREILAYLSKCQRQTKNFHTSSNRLGWLDTGADLVYVLPAETISNGSSTQVVYQPERYLNVDQTMKAGGSLENWQTQIAKPCEGDALLIFALCYAFSGCLLKYAPADLGSGGFNLYGRSSHGKTTALQVAASVWGSGADPAYRPEDSFAHRWHATVNGIEPLAAAHTDNLLCMDELGVYRGKDFGADIYALFGGRGKERADTSGDLRLTKNWRIAVLSTGEKSVRQMIEETGKTIKGGMLVRFIDVDFMGVPRKHDGDAAAAELFAKQLKEACSNIFGTAGPAFIRKLVALSPEQLSQQIKSILAEQKTLLVDGNRTPGAEIGRALDRFAQVAAAGILASRLDILPLDEAQISDAVKAVCGVWLKENKFEMTDEDRGVDNVRQFIQRHRYRFQTGCEPVPNCIGHFVAGIFNMYVSGFKEACGGQNHVMVAKRLNQKGLLKVDQKDTLQSRFMPFGESVAQRGYRIHAAILGDEQTTDETPQAPV
jgi:hypothetical protein